MATVTTNSPGLGSVRRSDLPLNVQQFASLVSGGDWAPALNAAWTAAQTQKRAIYMPAGDYPVLHANGVNWTNGEIGQVVFGDGPWRTRIIGRNGGIAVDMTGTRSTLLQGLQILADGETPSVVGLLQARSTTRLDASQNVLRDVSILLPHSFVPNSGYGTIALYNDTGELNTYDNVELGATFAAIFTRTNVVSITSPNTTRGSIASMSACSFVGACRLYSLGANPAVLLQETVGMNFGGTYVATWDGVPLSTVAAFWVYGINRNLRIRGHIEVYGRVVEVYSGEIVLPEIRVTHPQTVSQPGIVLIGADAGSYLRGGVVEIVSTNGTWAMPVYGSGAEPTGLIGTEVVLHGTQTLDLGTATAVGVIERGPDGIRLLLPTADGATGVLWNDAGTVKVSA